MKRILIVILLVLLLIIVSGCSRNDTAKNIETSTPIVTEVPLAETVPPSPSTKLIEDPLTVGDVVVFGAYEQDGDETNGEESLEWIVIDEQDGKLLLLTEKAIEVMNFAPFGSDGRWVISPIREWLNDEFYQKAFNDLEKEKIQLTTIKNYYRVDTSTGKFAEGVEVMKAGKHLFEDEDTLDYVFLLSDDEASKLSIEKRICTPTKFAVSHGAQVFGSGNTSWWLRSVGISQTTVQFVMQKGDIASYLVVQDGRCIRPAIWIVI